MSINQKIICISYVIQINNEKFNHTFHWVRHLYHPYCNVELPQVFFQDLVTVASATLNRLHNSP